MALKFGPQWLRDLSDGGTTNQSQPPTPTLGGKFKLAEYRYGREEMLALYNDSSPPPDQVRKHQSIFSKENQKPIAMSPLTEDEQRLMSQGFNSTVVLRAAVRGSVPPLRGRGGGTADRGRGRGRGRGEGYISRAPENGDSTYGRPAQDGWEHVGRKFERSFSRGYDEPSLSKREYSRSSSDNWRDKRVDDEKEDGSWRSSRDPARWGPSRSNWRDQQDFYDDRRPPLKYRDAESDLRGPRRTSENYENDEVPEWVEDDIEDDPGTFDSSGMFVAMKTGRRDGDFQDKPKVQQEDDDSLEEDKEEDMKRRPNQSKPHSATSERQEKSVEEIPTSVKRLENGTVGTKDVSTASFQASGSESSRETFDGCNGKQIVESELGGMAKSLESHVSTGSPAQISDTDILSQHSSVPTPENVSLPNMSTSTSNQVSGAENENFLHMEKSLQNLIAEMTVSAGRKSPTEMDVSKGALPLTHENANKWFYRDPQGEIQGPFKSEDMAQWFSAGYFTMSLIVKRGCDDSFRQLGELIKRYGRVPFLPGPPLPPLITTTVSPEEVPQATPTTTPNSIPALTMPSMVPHIMPSLIGAPVQPISDPMVFQQILAQQEYIKHQTYLMQQMQLQTLSKLQEHENFKALSMEQQQHLSMQMMMQTNPLFMQQFQQLQHQMLIQQQQQQQHQQQQQQQQQLTNQPQPPQATAHQPQVPSSETFTQSGIAPFGPVMSHPSTNMASPPTSFASSGTPTNSHDASENGSVWAIKQQPPSTGVWPQPSSLWDIDDNSAALNPAILAELEKKKKEEERLQEEERLRQEEIKSKAEELRRQQEEIERQREQVRREKEELERQKQLEIQKLEEVRKQEEERRLQEIERQKQESAERAKEKKRQEEERKKEKELKKQEEKRRKEEEKRRLLEQREQEEQRKREEEQEMLRQEELKREAKRQEELQLREEEERIDREAREKEMQRKQMELQRQQESLRRLQQQQKEQLANMQLPASSNWAKHQNPIQSGPVQSKSLTQIQEEEAQREREKEQEQQAQMQRMEAQAAVLHQQNLQKSWATHASKGIANRGLSLLDIQQQEQESAKKSQKERERSQIIQTKISQNIPTTWSGSNSGLWGTSSVWDNSNAVSNLGPWDQVPLQPNKRNQSAKESSEFPALKNPNQQAKKNAKSTKKAAVSKQKKEEESVQKLFQNQQQDGFTQWVTERVSQFSAQIDVPTFVSFIVEVESPDDVRDYVKTYLGETKECKDFARQFVEKRSQFKNKVRLEKQLEEDNIWGPAPAINPHSQSSGGNSNSSGGVGDGSQAKSKTRKKKQKMQKLDGSVLGFTVHADPNRKNAAGEFESVQ